MRPEEIDKLFKERLGNTSPTPPADLWARLQDRMEAEKPLQIQPKEEKRSFMWIYSSVAASMSLVLAVGMVFYNIKSTPEVSHAIVKQDQPVLEETPYFKEPAADETLVQVETTAPEKISETQATEDATPAFTITEAADKPATIAKATVSAKQQQKVTSATVARQPKANVQQAIANNTPTTDKAVETANAVPATKTSTAPALAATTTAASAEMNARPVEITIKRAVAAAEPTAMAEEAEPNGIEKKAKLAKNIFKQMRNLANGEQVELAELGINADRVALQTQIGKQKISKVINL